MTDYLDLDYISVEDAAQLTRTNPATVLAAISEGELTALKGIGVGYRTTREWVNAWVASKVVNPAASNLDLVSSGK